MSVAPSKQITFWQRVLLYELLFVALSFVQASLAMYPFKDQPSSSLSFDFYTDAFFASLIVSVGYVLVLFLVLRIQPWLLQLVVHLLVVGLLWFWIDFGIFQDREAGWSTYTTQEALYATRKHSLWIILLSCAFFVWSSWTISKRSIKSSAVN
ncbi:MULTISPECIES: hypothetical protein [unclassified Myroides]|uniref:hypothetical protein n=1 Tax=unclassified Myroides TaxID=2642485 RepID=UPI00257533B7|nr:MULTISPECIES: hypothetical protein [unclassified Myroides]